MTDLRSRVPGHAVLERTGELHAGPASAQPGDGDSWFAAVLGEQVVAGILSELGREWTVLHSVPLGPGDGHIDHVVIGPSGVYTITTTQPGRELWAAGTARSASRRNANPAARAAEDASRTETLLSDTSGLTVPVTPLMVLVAPGTRTVRTELPGGVWVLDAAELLDELRVRRQFSDGQLHRIVAAAVRPSTWRDAARP